MSHRALLPILFTLLAAAPARTAGRPPTVARYRVDIQSNGEADFAGLPGAQALPKTVITSHIAGELRLCRGAGPNSVFAEFTPKHLDIFDGASNVTPPNTTIWQDVHRPFIVAFDSAGRISSCHFDPSLSTVAKQTLLTIVGYLQAPRKAANLPALREETTSGWCTFSYRVASRTNHGWDLIKCPVQPNTSAESNSARPSNAYSGQLHLSLSTDAYLVPCTRVSGQVKQRTFWQGKDVAHSKTSVEIVRLKDGRSALPTPEIQRRLRTLALRPATHVFYQTPPDEVERNIQRNELGSASSADVIAMLTSLHNEPEAHRDLTQTYLKLNALLYLHPDAVENVRPVFDHCTPESAAFQIICRALTTVGNDACQKLLVDTVRTKMGDDAWASRLLATMTLLKSPNQTTVRYVHDLAMNGRNDNAAHMAVMVVGAFARTLMPSNPKQARALSYELLARLQNSSEPNMIKRYLGALGNVGSADTLRGSMQYVTSSDASIRAEAVAAVRFVQQPVVDDLLIHILETDVDATTRTEAVYAISVRPPSAASVGALQESIHDASRAVRASVVEALWGVRAKFPRIVATIQAVASDDPDKDLRSRAGQLIASQ